MLKDRLKNNKKLPELINKELIREIKDKFKMENIFISYNFLDRKDFEGKVYILLKNIIETKYPDYDFKIDKNLINEIISEVFGLGILEKFLCDKRVTDIFIQDKEMVVIRNGRKEYLGKVFNNIEEIFLIIDRIKDLSGKTIDQRMPFLNTDLYDGSRCSILIPPASDKIYISIRVFNCIDFELEDLFNTGMLDRNAIKILENFIKDRKNILIAGSMGSGKTTLLNTLAKLIPGDEFINIIQDVPEIKLNNHLYVRMLNTRAKSREIDNEINQEKLLYETLRMKADRIIVGEVRESMAAYQMLQALNTGHGGSFSTIHADSAYDALLRLETLTMEHNNNLNLKVVKKMISRAIDIVLFLKVEKNIRQEINRKLKEIMLIDDDLSEGSDYKLKYL